MPAEIFWLMVVGLVVLPFGGLVTILMFWRNPFAGSMFGALHLVIGTAMMSMAPELTAALPLELSWWVFQGKTTIDLSMGGESAAGYVVLGVAFLVFVVASVGYFLGTLIAAKPRGPGWLVRLGRWASSVLAPAPEPRPRRGRVAAPSAMEGGLRQHGVASEPEKR